MAKLPKPVWLLGWVSLATDAATEAIYPLLPFFLTQILGAGAVSLGIIEGAAEAVNSILKIIAGRVADRSPVKRPLVLVGYGISSAVRPLISIAQSWTHVFTIRMFDRVGKGIRGAPRDAMLATWATDRTRGRIYGFHRGMDHTGAVVGPAAATLFLYFYPGEYRTLFALTIIPGAIAVLLLFFVKEDEGADVASADVASADVASADVASAFRRTTDAGVPASQIRLKPDPTTSREPLPREFRNFMLVLALFTLGNSTDAFLLLKLTEAAGGAQYVPLMWAALHVVKASTSIVGGSWSDRVGRRAVIAGGWLIYAAVYAAFAVTNTLTLLLVWFLVYGCYFGLAEGTEKALVADLAPAGRRGFAFGIYNAVLGLGQLAASVVFGLIWTVVSPAAAFVFGAALALVATLALFIVVRPALSGVEGPRPI